MQGHGGLAAEAAITGFERSFLVDLRVDWNGNGAFDHPLSQLSEYVEDVSLDRAFTGSAPEELVLVEGDAAAELVIKLGGSYNGIPFTTIFSPYNTRSPLYGKTRMGAEVTYGIIVETEDGPVRYQQFIGNVRTISPVRGENYVEITALDRADKLRKPVRLVPWAVSDEHVNYGETDSQYVWSSWVIDSCLRMCDVSPTPKRPTYREDMEVPDEGLDGVQLYVTGNGSYLPTIGYCDNPNADSFPKNGTPMYRNNAQRHPLTDDPTLYGQPAGLAGLGLPVQQRYNMSGDQGIIRYWSADQDDINPRARHIMGFTLNTNGVNGTAFQNIGDFRALEIYIGMGRALEVWIGAGKVWSRRVNYAANGAVDTTAKVNIPTGRAHVDIFVEWDNTTGSGSRCYVRAGDNVSQANVGVPITSGSDVGADQIKGRVTIGQALNMSDIFYSVRNYYGGSMNSTYEGWRPATYGAVLDVGKNRFSFMPNDDTRDAWNTIKEVAAAEQGAVFFDEWGIFHFWNTDTIRDNLSTPVRDLNLDDITGLQVTENIDSVRNIYTVKTGKKTALMQGAVYESQDVNEFYVPARTEKRFSVFVDDVMSPLTFFMGKYMSKVEYLSGTNNFPVWGDNVKHGYCVQYQDVGNTGLWRELHDREGVDVRVYFTSGGILTVKIWNGWNEPIRLAGGSATDEAQPMFRVAGTKINEAASRNFTTKDRASIKKYGDQNITLDGTWYQDTRGTNTLVEELLLDSREPKPTTDAVTISGDPRLQLGDVLRVGDPGGLGEGLRMQIIGINRVFNKDDGLTDELTVELLNPDPTAAPTRPSGPTGLVATFLAPRTVQLSWNAVSTATSYKLYDEINEPAGVGQDGVLTTNSVIRQLPDGNYRFKVTALNGAGESSFSNIVAVTSPSGDVTPTVDAPYQILNIGPGAGQNHFEVGIGTDVHRDYSQAQIAAGFAQSPWFTINAAKNAVQFSAPLDGDVTSSSTTYARSELRELNPDGTKMGFDPKTNTHWMRGKTRITQVAPNKPDVVVAQLHSGSNDAISIRTQFTSGQIRLLFRINGTSSGLPRFTDTYVVGTEFEWMIELVNGQLRIYYNDMTTPFYTETLDFVATTDVRGRPNQFANAVSTFFFKAGAYNQSNETTDDPNGPTFRVELRDLKHWHTGWPTPGSPVTPGPQVSVNAGSDVTAASGAAVTRTATVANSTASGTWTVVSAPSGAGSVDQTLAAVKYGWGEPIAQYSDEFNYTGAPNASKWSVPGTDWAGHAGNGRRRPERQTVDGNKLVMTGLANGDTGWMASRFNQQYGKWECRVRSTNGTSNGNDYHVLLIIWPESNEWPEDGEYDFLELGVPGQTGYDSYTHYPHNADVSVQQIRVQAAGIDFSQWRNVAIEWDETGIQLYVDGNKVGSKMSGGANSDRRNIQDMPSGHLTIQLDNFDGTNQTPATYEVDFARIYPRNPVGDSGTGSIVGTTVGTSPSLNWTPPADGTYTLRYTLSTGEYDEFIVVVGTDTTPTDPGTPTGGVPWAKAYPDGTAYQIATGGGSATPENLTSLSSAQSNKVYNYTGSAISASTTVDFTGKSNITIKGITMTQGGMLRPKAGTNIMLENINAPYELSSGGEIVKWTGVYNKVRIHNSLFGPANEDTSPTTTKNRFVQFGDSTSVGAKYATVTRSTFRNKNGPGNMIHTVGDTANSTGGVRYTLIQGNLFIGSKPFDENDHETNLMGISSLQLTDGQQVIELNRYEQNRSEPEVISMKMNASVIRGNTFHNNVGSLSLRHGDNGAINDNWVYGFEQETGSGSYNRTSAGPRVYGAGHRIFNNTIQVNGNGGSRPSATALFESPLTLDSGDVAPGSTSNGHANIVDVMVENNLLVKCGNPIMVVDNYGAAPRGTIRNNWIVECANTPGDGVGTKGSSPSKSNLQISGNTVYSTVAAAGLTAGSGGHYVAPASAGKGARVPYLTASMVGQGSTFDPYA